MTARRGNGVHRAISPVAIMVALLAAPFLLIGAAARRLQANKDAEKDPYAMEDSAGRAGVAPMVLGTTALIAALFVAAVPAMALPIVVGLTAAVLISFVLTRSRSFSRLP